MIVDQPVVAAVDGETVVPQRRGLSDMVIQAGFAIRSFSRRAWI